MRSAPKRRAPSDWHTRATVDIVVRRKEIERAELLHAASEALEAGEVEEALSLFDEAIAVTSDQDLRDRMAAQLDALQSRYGPA